MDTLTDRETDRATAGDARRRWVVGAAIVAVGAVVAIGLMMLGGDPQEAEPSLSALPDEDVPAVAPEGNALLDLLEAGSALTFHAVYEAEAVDGDVAGHLQLDLFRDDGWVRQDSTVTAEGQTARTRAILSPDGEVTSCLEQVGEWSCALSSQPAEDLFGSLATQLTSGEVDTSSATVAGMEATCYALVDEAGRSELCVSEDGIPVRITAADGTTMELTELEREIDPAVFDPPAKPVSADT